MRIRLALIAIVALSLALPQTATGAGNSKAGGFLPPGYKAIELKAPTPDWYTAQLHEKVVKAGRQGRSVPLPEGVDIDSGLLFTGIRPGSWILFPAGCTTNFVFKGGTAIGTAGHCANVGDEVTIVALPGVLMNIGTVSLSANNGIGDDFALIDIYPEMQQYVNPSMAHWAGPTGSAEPVFGDVVVHSGHGLVIGTGGTPRAGVVTYVGEGDGGSAFGWDGEAMLGDSGSGVRNILGAAAGDLTHLVVGGPYVPAFIAGSTMAQLERYAGPVTTATLIPDPLF